MSEEGIIKAGVNFIMDESFGDQSENPAMNEWIKELEKNANEADSPGDHDLLQSNRWVHDTEIAFSSGSKKISLHGDEFTIEQLEALINHMKKYNETIRTNKNKKS